VVAPYYNRPTPEGLFRHYAKVAESVELPIVLYNVPIRTGVNIVNDVVVRLCESFPNIVAIKDATGNIDNATELRSRCDIAVLSGDDSLTWPFLAVGAVGVISVIANLSPSLMKSLLKAALGDPGCGAGFKPVSQANSSALQIHRKVYDLAVGIGRYGPNPIPIKTAMAIAGLVKEEFRLPLCPLDEQARAGVERVLRRHEIPQSA
jgi:4-hydroxy-tetrahydrodipicolinate synthase